MTGGAFEAGAGSMLRPASAAQGAAPCANAPGTVGPTQRATRAGEAIAATVPERHGRQHGIPRNVIGLLLSLDVSPLMARDIEFGVPLLKYGLGGASRRDCPFARAHLCP